MNLKDVAVSAPVGLGLALALAALAPKWLAYSVVGLIALWLVALGVDKVRTRGAGK
jgi:hypothetical protein